MASDTEHFAGGVVAPRPEGVPGDELTRLRQLVEPDEASYAELRLELWAVRDLMIGMEAELGNARSRCRQLERELEIARRTIVTLVDPSAEQVDVVRPTSRPLRSRRR
jgi:hypothetical protein